MSFTITETPIRVKEFTEVVDKSLPILILVAMLFSSLALVLSLLGIYYVGQVGTPGQTGIPGQPGQTGIAGQPGSAGQAGTEGATGATGTFSTYGFREETVCVRSNGQFDVFKGIHGGPETCPAGESEVVIVVRN